MDNLQRRQDKWTTTNEEAITYIPALHTAGTKVLHNVPLKVHHLKESQSQISGWWLTHSNHVLDNQVIFAIQVCTQVQRIYLATVVLKLSVHNNNLLVQLLLTLNNEN